VTLHGELCAVALHCTFRIQRRLDKEVKPTKW
jgi:hypothetical protein